MRQRSFTESGHGQDLQLYDIALAAIAILPASHSRYITGTSTLRGSWGAVNGIALRSK